LGVALGESANSLLVRLSQPLFIFFSAKMMNIELISNLQSFVGLVPEWTGFLADANCADAFSSPEWFSSWLATFAPAPDLLLLVAKAQCKIRAILPLMKAREVTCGLRVPAITSLTNCHSHCFDLITGKATDETQADLLSEMVHRAFAVSRRDIIILDHVSEDSVLLKMLFSSNGFPYKVFTSFSSENRQVSLDSSFDEYYNQLSSKFRKNVRAAERKALEHGPLELIHLQNPEDLSGLQSFYEMEVSGWKGQDEEAITQVRQAHDFYQALVRACGLKNWLDTYVLMSGEEKLAFFYCIGSGKTLRAVRIGINDSLRHLGPGMLLTKFTVERLFQGKRYRRWDFCGGSARWKEDWSNHSEKFYRVFIFRDNLMGKLLYRTAHQIAQHAGRQQYDCSSRRLSPAVAG